MFTPKKATNKSLIYKIENSMHLVLNPQEPPSYSRLYLYKGDVSVFDISLPYEEVEKIKENMDKDLTQFIATLNSLNLKNLIAHIEKFQSDQGLTANAPR